jgi:1,4-alpha-glucan branching enzyme
MKKDRNHKVNGTVRSNGFVRLEFHHPTAKSVSVAGTFNGWRPGATEMIQMEGGRWVKELVLPPGRYEYRLVVDNEWIADPRATETASYKCGGVNSVLKVPQPDRASNESQRA